MQEKNFSILLVEDEPNLAFSLTLNLEEEGYKVTHVGDGAEAIDLFKNSEVYDLVLLDLMIPSLNGFEVLKEIRAIDSQTSVLMITARADDKDRIEGLSLGADDYITKPFHLQELMLKVKRVFQRKADEKSSLSQVEPITYDGITLDVGARSLKTHAGTFDLTQIEVDIVKEFLEHKDEVLTREYLLEKAWNMRGGISTRTVDNFIVRIRKYLENDPANPVYLKSIRGKGYRFESKQH